MIENVLKFDRWIRTGFVEMNSPVASLLSFVKVCDIASARDFTGEASFGTL
ncbi:MAG: hypothetical protein WD795_17685 [Woeseia sp.]